MKKFFIPILFFFVVFSPFSIFADEQSNDSDDYGIGFMKLELRDHQFEVDDGSIFSDYPEYVTFGDISTFAEYNYPTSIVYDGSDYVLCGSPGADSCSTQSTSTSSSSDWFSSSSNTFYGTKYGNILPLTASTNFHYNYYGNGSTSMGYGLTVRSSPSGSGSDLISYGGGVGRPSSGTPSLTYRVDTSKSDWVNTLKPTYEFNCYGGGGSNHGTQSCSSSISKYYYRVGPHIESHTVSLSVSPAGSGSVTGSGTYEHGSVATISAIPNVDYVFKGWSDGNTDNPRNITVTSNVTLTANFEKLTYPQPPSPDITNNITNNIDQSTTINNNISFGSGSAGGGGGKVLFNQIDYYNLYSVYRVNFKQFVDSFGLKCNSSPSGDYTCEFDGYPDDISNGIKFEYVDTGDYLGGQYFFYIYDHSLLQARASNMLVSTDSITLDVCSPDNPDFCIKHSFALSDGAVARDVSEFNYEYVDGLNTYGYDRLANALTSQMTNKDNQVLFDYQGSVAKTSKSVLGSTSCMVSIYEKDGQSYSLNFAITDSVDTMNSINVQLNQKLEQTKQDLTNTELNQANQSLDKMNELLEVGNSQSQQSSNYLNSSNLELSNTINNYDNLEQGHLNDFSQNSAKIDTNFNFGDKFIKSARWVAIQFNNMTDNTPFGSLLQFSLLIGISLLIISKRL